MTKMSIEKMGIKIEIFKITYENIFISLDNMVNTYRVFD